MEKRKTIIIYENNDALHQIALLTQKGLLSGGLSDAELCCMDDGSKETVIDRLLAADNVIFGVKADYGDVSARVWSMVTSVLGGKCTGKRAAVFYLAAGTADNVDAFRSRLSFLGFRLDLQDFFITTIPNEADYAKAEDYGFGLACSIRRVPNPRKPELVRCLVCGEIFDASLGICPVCGVGLEQCVPVEEDASTYKKNTDRQYVIVGGGVAAVSAAAAVRQRDETGKIIMISRENDLPVNRPMLTKNLELVNAQDPTLFIHDISWYEKKNIQLTLGVAVVKVDALRQEVHLDNHAVISYDKLIYAAGAECFVPPFKGKDKKGVLTIRHLNDSKSLSACIKSGENAVIIGGGVLGLEAASELMRSGMKVTVLEASPQIIGRQADRRTADRIMEQMRSMGIACYEGVTIEEIVGDEHAEGVRLADGTVIPGRFILVSCGNRSNSGVLADAGAKTDRAVVVNAKMETSIEHVYACGDCAQLDGINYQLWQEALAQGQTAGANAAGECVLYKKQMLGLSLEGFGMNLFAIGDPGKRQGMSYKTVVVEDDVTGRYEKYWFFGGSMEGAVIINSPEKVAKVSKAVTEHGRYAELQIGI